MGGQAPKRRGDAGPRDSRGGGETAVTDTAPGLYKFNLGSVPASVTPPTTWRRAAWFTIISSVGALGVLLYIASLVTVPAQPGHLALPQSSRSSTRSTLITDIGTATSANGPTPEVTPQTHVATIPPRPRPSPTTNPTSAVPPAPEQTRPSQGTTTPGSVVTPPPPKIVILNNRGPARIDVDRTVEIALSYLRGLSDEAPRHSYGLTGGALRAAGYESFAQLWCHIASITVTELRIDRSSATVVALSRVSHRDGSEDNHTQRLTFGDTEPLLIVGDTPLSASTG